MVAIKAIETSYNGYLFRSRLEARWAVFFDAADIRYEYEAEGFELASGVRYLPDFYLPELEVHVEVKPRLEAIAINDLEKIIRFSIDARQELLLIIGDPGKASMYLPNGYITSGWEETSKFIAEEGYEDHREGLFESLHDYCEVRFWDSPRALPKATTGGITLAYSRLNPYIHYHLNGAELAAAHARFERGKTPKGPRDERG